MKRLYWFVLFAAMTAHAEIIVTADRNVGAEATSRFHFKRVPPPARDDAAAAATFTLIAGTIERSSGGLRALNDGIVPAEEDEPGANLFFRAGTWGGRFRIDLGVTRDIAQINTYSWHPDSRAPQLYKVYGSDGSDPHFNGAPDTKLDPRSCGWRLIAFVDTRAREGEDGGQHGVSITDSSGTLGKYRYLLFDCFETEGDDNYGNTFYSEIDVSCVSF